MQTINPNLKYLVGPPPISPTDDALYIASAANFNLILLQQNNDSLPGASSPLQFQFTTSQFSTTSTLKWNICTNITLGQFCMDQWGNNASQPALQRPGNVTGQQWTLTANNDSGSTRWQMQSDFAGPLDFLSAYGVGLDSLAMSSDAPVANTYFEFVEVSDSGPATSSSVPVVTSSTWTPAAAAATSAPKSPSVGSGVTGTAQQVVGKHSLSSGAIAGIVIGVVAIIGIFAGLFWLCCAKRRRSMKRTQVSAEIDSQPQMATPATMASQSDVFTRQNSTLNSSGGKSARIGQRVHELPAADNTHE